MSSEAYRDLVLADSPLAYYRLDEPSGTNADDESPNNRDGTYVGTTLGATGRFGDEGGAIMLDGIDDHVTVPTSVTLSIGSSVTIEYFLLVATTEITGSSAFNIGNLGDPDRCQVHGPYVDSNLYWDYGHSGLGGRVITSYVPYLDQWTHLAFVFNSATSLHAIYLNGVLANSTTNANAPTQVLSGGQIGFWAPGGRLKGTIDEFAVYNTPLSAARLVQHVTAANPASNRMRRWLQ